MSGKHTAGPWLVAPKPFPGLLVTTAPDGDGEVYNVAWAQGAARGPESLANARLIAAAPDMLECLVEIRERMFHGFSGSPVTRALIAKSEAAIAKAIGAAA